MGTKENPADLVSRGCNPKELLSSTLWWQGPAWLRNQDDINIGQPLEADIADDFEYCKQDTAVTLIATPQQEENWLYRFSTFTRLVRVTAYCIKFIQLCRKMGKLKSSQALSLDELNYAKRCLIKMEQ